MAKTTKLIFSFLFFWIFLLMFKFGAGLDYALLSPLGSHILPLWIVGLVMSAASLFQLTMDIPAGRILDMFGYKRVMMFGTLLALIGVALFFYGITIVSFIFSIILVYTGWLFFEPGKNAYVLSSAKPKNAAMFMGYRDVSGSIGIVLSCLILPFVVDASSKTIAMVLTVLLGIALVAICLAPIDKRRIALKDNPHERTHHQRRFTLKNISAVLKRLSPASSLLMLLNFAGSIFYGAIWFVVPLIIAQAVYNGTLLGVGLAMFDFSIVIIGSILCNMVNRAETKMLIFVGLMVFSVAGFLLGFNFGVLFLVFAFLSTTGDETASLPLWAWLHKLDKKHNSDGLISGAINLAEDLGWAAGPLFAGLLYAIVGPKYTIALASLPIVAVLLFYVIAVRGRAVKATLKGVPPKPHKHRHKK
jgi:MFS family permease